jgi:myo-inositol-1(or 4)-monophosphatase
MDDLLRTAIDSAEAAASIHRRYSGEAWVEAATDKGTSDFVSRVDLEAQEAALSVIRQRFPGHRILAEEDHPGREDAAGTRSSPGGAETPVWIVEPLDGTTNYLHGHPQYAASVAVVEGGSPAAAAVVAPATGERWWARRGSGAFKGGVPVRVSTLRRFDRALVGTGFPFKALQLLPDYLEQFGRVLQATAGIRRGGSAALDLCALASGVLDAFWELFLNPWDVAAGILLVTEAGGWVTRLDGSPVGFEEPGTILAANSPEFLEELGRRVQQSDFRFPD